MSGLEQDYFPSWRLGYRCNPFRALTRPEWIELALIPEVLRERGENLPRLTQIMGAPGSGKTSALLALQREFEIRGNTSTYEYLPPGATRITSELTAVSVYLLDEAQRLSPSHLKKLMRSTDRKGTPGLRLILSTHEDLADAAAANGLSMLSICLEALSNHFIYELIERRLKYFERPDQRGIRVKMEALEYALTLCNRNLRLLERLLYEAYQTWTGTTPIDLDHIKMIDLN